MALYVLVAVLLVGQGVVRLISSRGARSHDFCPRRRRAPAPLPAAPRYDLKDGERRGLFHITREGSKVDEAGDLFGLDLAGVEAWIREQAKRR